MNKRRFIPLTTRKQVVHTLLICMISVLFTAGVAVLELYFLNAINQVMVQDLSSPVPLIQFLQLEREWLFYGLIGLMVLTIAATFILTVRFTNKIFGPAFSLTRDLKKQTFLGLLRSDLHIRKEDYLQGLVSQYRQTGEALDHVHRSYVDAYEEIDHSLDAIKNEKKSA